MNKLMILYEKLKKDGVMITDDFAEMLKKLSDEQIEFVLNNENKIPLINIFNNRNFNNFDEAIQKKLLNIIVNEEDKTYAKHIAACIIDSEIQNEKNYLEIIKAIADSYRPIGAAQIARCLYSKLSGQTVELIKILDDAARNDRYDYTLEVIKSPNAYICGQTIELARLTGESKSGLGAYYIAGMVRDAEYLVFHNNILELAQRISCIKSDDYVNKFYNIIIHAIRSGLNGEEVMTIARNYGKKKVRKRNENI